MTIDELRKSTQNANLDDRASADDMDTALGVSASNENQSNSDAYSALAAPIVDTGTVIADALDDGSGEGNLMLRLSREKAGFYEDDPDKARISSGPGQLIPTIGTYLLGAGAAKAGINTAAK